MPGWQEEKENSKKISPSLKSFVSIGRPEKNSFGEYNDSPDA